MQAALLCAACTSRVVPAMEIVSEAQTFAFPGEHAGWARDVEPWRKWPSWRAVLCSGRHHESRVFAAQMLDLHGRVKVQGASRTRTVGAGMLDVGALSDTWALTVRQMSCCWTSSCTAI